MPSQKRQDFFQLHYKKLATKMQRHKGAATQQIKLPQIYTVKYKQKNRR